MIIIANGIVFGLTSMVLLSNGLSIDTLGFWLIMSLMTITHVLGTLNALRSLK